MVLRYDAYAPVKCVIIGSGGITWNNPYSKKNHLKISTERYRQVSNISRTLVGNKIVDHSDVVGAISWRCTCVNIIGKEIPYA